MMTTYKYEYPVDIATKIKLSNFSIENWQEEIVKILKGNRIDLNINFTDYVPQERLCTIFNLLLTNDIEIEPYQTALVSLLTEYYGKTNKSSLSYSLSLIKTIGHTRPAKYYKDIEVLVTTSENSHMIYEVDDDGLSIHFHLILSIMAFDKKRSLYQYLKTLQYDQQPPEYYQVMIHYIWSYCEQEEFDSFMNCIFKKLDNSEIKDFVIFGFREYSIETSKFVLIYYWLFENKDYLKQQSNAIFTSFTFELYNNWLIEYKDDYDTFEHFYPLLTLLAIFQNESESISDYLKRILKESEKDLYNKSKLLEYIGMHSPKTEVIQNDDGSYKIIVNDKKKYIYSISSKLSRPIEYLINGINKGQMTKIKKMSISALSIPTQIIRDYRKK